MTSATEEIRQSMEHARAQAAGTVHDLAQVDVKDQIARRAKKTKKEANAQAHHALDKAVKASRPAAAARRNHRSRRRVSVPIVVLAIVIVCVVGFRLKSKGAMTEGTDDEHSSNPTA